MRGTKAVNVRRGLSLWVCFLLVVSTTLSHAEPATTARPAAQASAPPTPAPAPAAAPAAAAPAPAAPTAPPPNPNVPLAESLTGMARAEYAAAKILYEDGDYKGALTKLENTYKLSGDPRLLWNMAACEKNLRHYALVSTLLDRYLAEGAAFVSAEDRAAADELLGTVRSFVTDLELAVEPAGTEVIIDGESQGLTPLPNTLHLDMGPHELVFSKAGYVTRREKMELAGGQVYALKIALVVEKHEGQLRVVSDPGATIRVDGKIVGQASWHGTLPSGVHTVHISAPGKAPHQTEVVVKDNDTSSLHIGLSDRGVMARDDGTSPWWWVAGGAVLAGAGVGAYFIFKPKDDEQKSEVGTWGAFEL